MPVPSSSLTQYIDEQERLLKAILRKLHAHVASERSKLSSERYSQPALVQTTLKLHGMGLAALQRFEDDPLTKLRARCRYGSVKRALKEEKAMLERVYVPMFGERAYRKRLNHPDSAKLLHLLTSVTQDPTILAQRTAGGGTGGGDRRTR